MQLSRYIRTYPCKDRSGHLLLFSTKRASVLRIKEETFRSLEKGEPGSESEAVLSRYGILVPDREEEKREVVSLPDRLNVSNPLLHLIVILNLDCNFDCPYCYEGDRKGPYYMSATTEDQLIGFIKERFTDEKTSLLVDFHGGEPLLSFGQIKTISQELQSFTERRGRDYGFTLTTNGSLFVRPVAETLVPLGLGSVKITLDGPAEIHNESRPFKSGAGSFDTIIKNLKQTWDLAKISIGGNYTQENHERFPRLLETLERAGLTPETLSHVKFDPVVRGPGGERWPAEGKEGCVSINEPWIPGAERMLREAILKAGYNTPRPSPMHCMVETADSYVVNVDGSLYKCPTFIGNKDFVIGDLQTGVADYASSHSLGIWKNETCEACVYLPLCYGGCRYMSYVRDGDIHVPDCRKDYLDVSLETMITQDLTYRPKTTRTEKGGRIELQAMTGRIDSVIERTFPKQLKAFHPPTMERVIASYRNICSVIETHVYGRPGQAEEPGTSTLFNEPALFAVAAIRYIDDFIDHALWPCIQDFEPSELSTLFEAFLQDVLEAVREFDPEMPDSIIDLPRLEMHLALNPSQENFDRNFRNLFRFKSKDMFYVYQRVQGDGNDENPPEKLMRLALMDYIRDFSSENIAKDTDLNLYKYIREHRIDPKRFLDFLIHHYRQEDPEGYRRAGEAGLTGEEADPASTHEEDAVDPPFHASSSILFQRAIRLLNALPVRKDPEH